MHNYSLGFAFTDKEVCLVTKAEPDWQKGRLNGVGGKVKPGESFLEAMVREFTEETEYRTSNWQTALELYNDTFHMLVFKAFFENTFRVKGTLEEPVGWYNLSYVLGKDANKIDNLQWIIPMLRDKFIKFPVSPIEY